MARYIYQGTFKDQNGKVVTSGTISVFEADSTDVANVYVAQSGGSAVNSVTSDSTNGSFVFYVDDGDYTTSQKFKITLSKTDYQSKSYDDINIFPQVSLTGAETLSGKTLVIPTIGSMTNAQHDHADAAGGGNTLLVPTIASMANANHDHSNAAEGGTAVSTLQVKVSTTTRNMADATGTQTITGIGFIPKSIEIVSSINNANSTGFSDGTDDGCVFTRTTAITSATSASVIHYETDASNKQVATLDSFDADGFTLSWTKTGTPTAGTLVIYYKCIR